MRRITIQKLKMKQIEKSEFVSKIECKKSGRNFDLHYGIIYLKVE